MTENVLQLLNEHLSFAFKAIMKRQNYHQERHEAGYRFAGAIEALERAKQAEEQRPLMTRQQRRSVQKQIVEEIAQRNMVKSRTVTKWLYELLWIRYQARMAIANLPNIPYHLFCVANGWFPGN